MRDPQNIIGAFITKMARKHQAGIILTAHTYPDGRWRAAVIGHGIDVLHEGRSVSLDGALQALASAVQNAEAREGSAS